MSSESAIHAIKIVKEKLEKYIQTKQDEKVKEYLQKLYNTSVNASLLRETNIDAYVNQIASNSSASYSTLAKSVVKKWQQKNLSKVPDNSVSKVKTITNTSQPKTGEKLAVKRKSDHDDESHRTSSSSQQSRIKSSDDSRSTNPSSQSSSSSSNKKRKVLSVSEYLSSKKPAATTINANENMFADADTEQIYAQFNANIETLGVNAQDLASNVNKKLKEKDSLKNNDNGLANNGSHGKLKSDSAQTKGKGFWDSESDDDEDEDEKTSKRHATPPVLPRPTPITSQKQPAKKPTPPEKKEPTKSHSNTTVKSEPVSSAKKKIANVPDPSIVSALVATTAPIKSHFPPPPPPPPPSQPAALDASNMLRSKQSRQAIYSGKRAIRTTVPSLQELCIEKLKDNIEETSQKFMNMLPFDVVKPIIEAASAEQLDSIVLHNPDYADDVEPLWKTFCMIKFKDAVREECETYHELYLRKMNEYEEKLRQCTASAKRKIAQTVTQTRQTKTISFPQMKVSKSANSKGHLASTHRLLVNLPSSRFKANAAKAKKPTITPLLKKTLKLYQSKNY